MLLGRRCHCLICSGDCIGQTSPKYLKTTCTGDVVKVCVKVSPSNLVQRHFFVITKQSICFYYDGHSGQIMQLAPLRKAKKTLNS